MIILKKWWRERKPLEPKSNPLFRGVRVQDHRDPDTGSLPASPVGMFVKIVNETTEGL